MAGGINVKSWRNNISYYDDKFIIRVKDLELCLSHLGWKSSAILPFGFKAGYPIIHTDNSHSIIAVFIIGKNIRFVALTTDYSNQPLKASVNKIKFKNFYQK